MTYNLLDKLSANTLPEMLNYLKCLFAAILLHTIGAYEVINFDIVKANAGIKCRRPKIPWNEESQKGSIKVVKDVLCTKLYYPAEYLSDV